MKKGAEPEYPFFINACGSLIIAGFSLKPLGAHHIEIQSLRS